MAKKKVKVFNQLRTALADSLRFEAGERVDLRVATLPPPPKRVPPKRIRQIRHSLNASQALFARYLNVSANTVRSWEQGTRVPREAALKLLSLASRNPQALLEA